MELMNYIQEMINNPTIPTIALIGAVTIFEIAPIKINPWTWLLKRIGNAMNGDLSQEIENLKEDITTIKKDQQEDNADNMRCRILDFASSCRRHEHHDAEEWNMIISLLKKYETYVKDREIDNGVIEENALYLRELYHKRLINNDFE